MDIGTRVLIVLGIYFLAAAGFMIWHMYFTDKEDV